MNKVFFYIKIDSNSANMAKKLAYVPLLNG